MENPLLDGFYLKETRVEPLTGRYEAPGRSGHLASRAVEVLLCLARRPRRLVPREELLSKVWGDGGGSAETLTHAISDLRHALEDHPESPEYIQTVRRRGYRLLVTPRLLTENTKGGARDKEESFESGFWARLVRHGVVQASLAYLVVGWLLIQVADATFPNLDMPNWSVKFVTYVVIGGLPVVILLSWFLEGAGGKMIRDRGRQQGGWLSGLGRNYLAVVAAYAVATLVVAVYQVTDGLEPPGSLQASRNGQGEVTELLPVEPNSVAVLKFLSLDGSDRSRIFSDGLSEDILDRLAKVGPLSVSSRSDSWALPEDVASEQVRRRLRVAYFVEGTVRLIGNDLRVVAQLIDSATGRHVISRSFDRRLDDYLAVQKEITRDVVSNLRVALPEEHDNLPTLGIDEAEIDTYMLYQQGRYLLHQPPEKEVLTAAERLFERALEQDPGFAVAHAGICDTQITLYELDNDSSHIDRAEEACAAARTASGGLPEVYTALGRLKLVTGDLERAETAYRAALDLNARDTMALEGMSMVYERQQNFEDAQAFLNLAIDIQPGNWRLMNSLAVLEYIQGRYSAAAKQWQRVVFLDPDNYVLRSNLGSAQILAGEFEAARDTIEAALEIKETGEGYSNLGVIYYCLGNYAMAADMHRRAIAVSPLSDVAWANLGDALHFLGDEKAAVGAFARANELAAERLNVNPFDVEALYMSAWALAMTGDVEAARRTIGRALEQAPEDTYANYYAGLIHTRAGNLEAAADAIWRAADTGYPRSMLAVEPHLATLRSTPEFAGRMEEQSRL